MGVNPIFFYVLCILGLANRFGMVHKDCIETLILKG